MEEPLDSSKEEIVERLGEWKEQDELQEDQQQEAEEEEEGAAEEMATARPQPLAAAAGEEQANQTAAFHGEALTANRGEPSDLEQDTKIQRLMEAVETQKEGLAYLQQGSIPLRACLKPIWRWSWVRLRMQIARATASGRRCPSLAKATGNQHRGARDSTHPANTRRTATSVTGTEVGRTP